MTLQKHRETLTENDIEELISETVKLKEIQVPRAIASRTSCRVESKLFGHEIFFLGSFNALELSTLAERYSLGGMGGHSEISRSQMPKNALLLCGRNDFRHKGMVV